MLDVFDAFINAEGFKVDEASEDRDSENENCKIVMIGSGENVVNPTGGSEFF